MKHFLMSLLVLTIGVSIVWAAATEITPVEITSVELVDSTFTRTNFALITTTDGVTFPNNNLTFVVLYDSTGGTCTATVSAPASTIRIAGYGTVTLSDLTIPLESGSSKPNIAYFKVPMRYNSSGMATITVDEANRMKVAVFKLAKE